MNVAGCSTVRFIHLSLRVHHTAWLLLFFKKNDITLHGDFNPLWKWLSVIIYLLRSGYTSIYWPAREFKKVNLMSNACYLKYHIFKKDIHASLDWFAKLFSKVKGALKPLIFNLLQKSQLFIIITPVLLFCKMAV